MKKINIVYSLFYLIFLVLLYYGFYKMLKYSEIRDEFLSAKENISVIKNSYILYMEIYNKEIIIDIGRNSSSLLDDTIKSKIEKVFKEASVIIEEEKKLNYHSNLSSNSNGSLFDSYKEGKEIKFDISNTTNATIISLNQKFISNLYSLIAIISKKKGLYMQKITNNKAINTNSNINNYNDNNVSYQFQNFKVFKNNQELYQILKLINNFNINNTDANQIIRNDIRIDYNNKTKAFNLDSINSLQSFQTFLVDLFYNEMISALPVSVLFKLNHFFITCEKVYFYFDEFVYLRNLLCFLITLILVFDLLVVYFFEDNNVSIKCSIDLENYDNHNISEYADGSGEMNSSVYIENNGYYALNNSREIDNKENNGMSSFRKKLNNNCLYSNNWGSNNNNKLNSDNNFNINSHDKYDNNDINMNYTQLTKLGSNKVKRYNKKVVLSFFILVAFIKILTILIFLKTQITINKVVDKINEINFNLISFSSNYGRESPLFFFLLNRIFGEEQHFINIIKEQHFNNSSRNSSSSFAAYNDSIRLPDNSSLSSYEKEFISDSSTLLKKSVEQYLSSFSNIKYNTTSLNNDFSNVTKDDYYLYDFQELSAIFTFNSTNQDSYNIQTKNISSLIMSDIIYEISDSNELKIYITLIIFNILISLSVLNYLIKVILLMKSNNYKANKKNN